MPSIASSDEFRAWSDNGSLAHLITLRKSLIKLPVMMIGLLFGLALHVVLKQETILISFPFYWILEEVIQLFLHSTSFLVSGQTTWIVKDL